MNELIHIVERDGQRLVDARELYSYLEVKARFNDWIRRRIKEYGFVEGVDFTFYSNLSKTHNGRPSKEYALTITCAKELAMVEGNKKGKAARLYFIECERRLKESSLEQRVQVLEAKVAQLQRQLVKPTPLKQLPQGMEVDLVRKHFGPPLNDAGTKFMSTSEIAAYIRFKEKVPVGSKRIAQAIISVTGSLSSFQKKGTSTTKRGYYVQTLTAL